MHPGGGLRGEDVSILVSVWTGYWASLTRQIPLRHPDRLLRDQRRHPSQVSASRPLLSLLWG